MAYPLFRHACRCCGRDSLTFWFVGSTDSPVYVEAVTPLPPHPKSQLPGQSVSHTLSYEDIEELHRVLTRWLDRHPGTIPRRPSVNKVDKG